MNELKSVFSNREIALGFWITIVFIILVCTKAGKEFIQSIIPIIFSKKFIAFYIVFISAMVLIIRLLHSIGFWDLSLLKETIFWVFFVQIPIFVRTIEKAKDHRFFRKLIKDNVKLAVVISFVLEFWSFSLLIEMVLIPIIMFFSVLYFLVEKNKEYAKVKQVFMFLFTIAFIYLIVYTLRNLILHHEEFFNIFTLNSYLLPILLLIFNLPTIYGLALYNNYEQIFIRLKGNEIEQRKMKKKILQFSKLNLAKISILRNRNIGVISRSLSDEDLKQNLEDFVKYLQTRVGDNYMKRCSYYYFWSIVGIIISIIVLIAFNSEVGIKEILTLNFVVNFEVMKHIGTQICIVGIVVSIAGLVMTIGLRNRKFEEISQVKRLALHGFLYCLQRQIEIIKRTEMFPEELETNELFISYIQPASEIKTECDRIISSYDNLLNIWELECVKRLQTCTSSFLSNIFSNTETIDEMRVATFRNYYEKRVVDSPQNEKINVYLHNVEKGLEEYKDQIRECNEEFKNLL